MASFLQAFRPTLDAIRSSVPTSIGVRSATLTVRTVLRDGNLLDEGNTTVTDTPIVSSTGDRYKVRVVSTKDVVASGGLYQRGSLRVGPITPPFAGSGFTKDQLIPPSVPGQEVHYGITDGTGQTQWCQMASSDTLHDLHWFIVLNPAGVLPEAP